MTLAEQLVGRKVECVCQGRRDQYFAHGQPGTIVATYLDRGELQVVIESPDGKLSVNGLGGVVMVSDEEERFLIDNDVSREWRFVKNRDGGGTIYDEHGEEKFWAKDTRALAVHVAHQIAELQE